MRKLLLGLGASGIVAIGIALGALFGAFTANDAPPALAAAPAGQIGVHGQWTIDVLDLDGALVSRREFHNDLTNSGRGFLADILGRNASAGYWWVRLDGSGSGTHLCREGFIFTHPVPCNIREPEDPTPASPIVEKTLEVSHDAVPLRITGTFVARRNGDIATVTTFGQQCDYNVAPPCPDLNPSFTSTAISPPIAVLEGQQVLVDVEISFSAAP